jgi:hypothetical protein
MEESDRNECLPFPALQEKSVLGAASSIRLCFLLSFSIGDSHGINIPPTFDSKMFAWRKARFLTVAVRNEVLTRQQALLNHTRKRVVLWWYQAAIRAELPRRIPEIDGGRSQARTGDLLLVRQAL